MSTSAAISEKRHEGPWRSWGEAIGRAPETSVVVVLVLLWIGLAWLGKLGDFSSDYNRENLARSVALQAIFGIGELLVILTGGIDLSVGSLVGFAGMLLAYLMNRFADGGMGIAQATVLAVLLTLGFSLLLGVVHAALIHYLKLPPFVVTLASMSMLRSAALILNNQVPIPIDRFGSILFAGNGRVLDHFFLNVPALVVAKSGTHLGMMKVSLAQPVPLVVLVILSVIAIAVLGFTRTGRRVYSVGSNEEAARLAGVNVFHVRLFVYGACSLLAGLAGILYAGYGSQGDPSAGLMFELNAISAVVIGGAVLTGGRGSVIGTLLGTMLLQSILSMINFSPLKNPTLWSGMVVGGVLLAAVVLNQIRLIAISRRAGRKLPG